MSQREEHHLSTITNYKSALTSIGAVAAGVILMFVGEAGDFAQWLKSGLSQVGGAIVTTGLIAVLWDLSGKRALAKEVLAKARLSGEIQESGISKVSMRYLDRVEWDALFSKARNVDVFVAYGETWRKTQIDSLRGFLSNESSVLRVILPDREWPPLLAILADRFSMTVSDVDAAIRKAEEGFSELRRDAKGTVEIYKRKGDPLFACYRFDSEIIATLYSHKRDRVSVPVLALQRGGFHDFFKSELDSIINQSTQMRHPIESLRAQPPLGGE